MNHILIGISDIVNCEDKSTLQKITAMCKKVSTYSSFSVNKFNKKLPAVGIEPGHSFIPLLCLPQ